MNLPLLVDSELMQLRYGPTSEWLLIPSMPPILPLIVLLMALLQWSQPTTCDNAENGEF